MKIAFLSITFICISWLSFSQSLTIEFDNIRNDEGQLIVTVYPSEDIWLDEIDELEHYFPKENIVDGKMSVTINEMQTGIFGVAMMDDENGDGEMKYNFIGMPREGYGFSRNFKVRLSKPDFDDSVLELKNDTTIRITVQYM